MKEFLISFFSGLIFTVSFFLISVIIVVGIKTIFSPKQTVIKPKQPKKKIRTLEINPDEIDRINVKKVS